MFTIFNKNVGGREHDRYFHSWEAARAAMKDDIDSGVRLGCWTVTKKVDYFNTAKGFSEYFQEGITKHGERVRWALISGYFEDSPAE